MLTFKEGALPIKVLDEPESESELEKDMIDWNIQSTKQKRLSDDKSIELFGKNNVDRYNIYKHKFLEKPIEKDIEVYDGFDTIKESYVDFDRIGKDNIHSAYAIMRSKRYKDLRNIVVLYPMSNNEELEKVKAEWEAMPSGDKLLSDDHCKEIWGVTNDEMYDACKALIDKLENNAIHTDPLHAINSNQKIDGYLDANFINITDIVKPECKDNVSTVRESTILIQDNRSRNDILRESLYKYDLMSDKDSNEAKVLEDTILSLGWIPGIPYNTDSMKRASLFVEGGYDIIDSTDDKSITDIPDIVDNDILRPVYIVLVQGVTLFSNTIMKVTKGPFSHAAICIDDTFKRMYSFNIGGSEGKAGGLSIEDASKYPKDSKLGVYAIFVKDKDYHTIENLLEMYDKNKKNTSYSFLNVLALPFNASIKMDFNMICSEFVDNILKLTNINIVDKKSPLVTPNDFYRASQSNKKIYKLYEGKVKYFLPKTIAARVAKLKKEYIKEYAILESDFPVQFSDDGDLMIKNMKKLNYNEEIAKSNRLLKIYYKEDNREGTKYELAKLWFICNLIGADIDAGKNKVENTKSKATAFNVFDTYLKLLLQKEKNFNFMRYYESTPFNDATIKIKASTIKYSIDTLKAVLLS